MHDGCFDLGKTNTTMEMNMRIARLAINGSRLAINGSAVLAVVGVLAICVADNPASAAVHARKCSASQSVLNGECVDNSFINPDVPASCHGAAACYRRVGHKHKTHRKNT
jgi:hypothetical protein